MIWLSVLAVLLVTQDVHGIMNSTAFVVTNDGLTVYPCWQVNHTERILDPTMLGQWYVIEIIQHRDEIKNKGTQVLDICPKLSIFRASQYLIELIWREKAGTVHYSFRLTDPENEGFWMASSRQTGSMLNKSYGQFAGSVQITDAHPNQMALTFCANNLTHYSVVLVRNITTAHDTRDVRQALVKHGLPEIGVRETCRESSLNSSAIQSVPTLLIMLMSVFVLVFRLKQ